MRLCTVARINQPPPSSSVRARTSRFSCAGENRRGVTIKEPDDEGVASHSGPESCADVRRTAVKRSRGRVGWVLSREIRRCPGCRRREKARKATSRSTRCKLRINPARSKTPRTRGHTSSGNRQIPGSPWTSRPHREVSGHTAMMDHPGKSDRPEDQRSHGTRPRNGRRRWGGKGADQGEHARVYTRSGHSAGQTRPARSSEYDSGPDGTGHSGSPRCSITCMPWALTCAPRTSRSNETRCPGVDGETWQQDGGRTWRRIFRTSPSGCGAWYRAKPVRRAYIPKADGRPRPLGVPALEDKIVQRAVVEALHAIYEADFRGVLVRVSAWRRSPHQALDALDGRHHDEEGELGARCGHPEPLRYGGAWMVAPLPRAPCGSVSVAECASFEKWLSAGVLDEGQRIVTGGWHGAGREYRARLAGECLPPLRLRPRG